MDSTSIREQIDSILHSETFAGKSQLMKLLGVLFDHIDSQSTLKPDCVIRELWPDETRTKRSADVATEMNRLRKALEAYYAAEGAHDPVLICLPNRSVAANGHKEKHWIVAEPRCAQQSAPVLPTPRASSRGRLKIAAAIAATVALGVAGYLLIRTLTAVDQPQSARLDGSTLIVMNAKGEDLWRKTFSGGLSTEYYTQGLALRMWFGDLDGDGHTDVLFLDHPAGTTMSMSHSTTLICYSDRGKEKWRWTPGRELPELDGNPATFKTVGLGVLKATHGTHSRIVVSSYHLPYYPHQIAILDTNGKTVSEYWHSGHLDYLTLADLDGDGREEIIATGISNGYHQATLVVLDPERVFGASSEAARPEIQLHGMGAAQERVRLLFHRSDLNMVLGSYNEGQEATVEHGMIRFSVLECRLHIGCLLWYKFDKNFHLLSAEADDYFRSAHREFYIYTKTDHPFTPEEEKEFAKVRCLTGCKTEFVSLQFH